VDTAETVPATTCNHRRVDAPAHFVALPDEVCFTLDEVADVLFVVDLAVEAATRGGSDRVVARRVQRLISGRLWPELGDLLNDDGDEEQ
jgi:hypothetical protein